MSSGATLRRRPSKEQRAQTRNVQNIERPVKVSRVSLVPMLTLHQADGTLLFWSERIAKLAEGLFRYAGRSVRTMMHTETPVRVLKLTGSARSGYTILDVVLGSHPDIESVGEVDKLFRTGWISRESLRGIDQKRLRCPFCTCGKRLDVLYVDTPDEACLFWSRVRREWVERTDPEGIENYPRLRGNFEREPNKNVGVYNATTGRPGIEDRPLPYGAATFMDINGMAFGPIWLQEMISKNVLVFLLELSTPGKLPGTSWG
jgi:hypothetical protein